MNPIDPNLTQPVDILWSGHVWVGCSVVYTKFFATIMVLAASVGVMAPGAVAQGVCLITQAPGSVFDRHMRDHTQSAAHQAGLEFLSEIGAHARDHNQQVDAVDTCIARGASGLLIDPVDLVAIGDAVRHAQNEGVMVVVLNTALDDPGLAEMTIVPDYVAAGGVASAALRRFARQDADGFVVAVVEDATMDTPHVARFGGFLNGLASAFGAQDRMSADAATGLVTIGPFDTRRQDARRARAALMQTNEHINVVYTPFGDLAVGTADALAGAQPSGGVVLVPRDACAEPGNDLDDATGDLGTDLTQLRIFGDPEIMADLGVGAIARWTQSGMRRDVDGQMRVVPVGLSADADLPQNPASDRSWVVVELCWR